MEAACFVIFLLVAFYFLMEAIQAKCDGDSILAAGYLVATVIFGATSALFGHEIF